MKKNITVLLLFFYQLSLAGVYYVSTTGNDATGNGTEGNPYKTLYYAASQAVSTGDIIFIKAGTYNETQEAILKAGVSIDGDGQGVSIINSTLNSSGHYALRLASSDEGTDGNQFIRNITLTGSSLTALNGIYIYMRSNVSIYNCTLKDFISKGVYFEGQKMYKTRPGIYATNNKLYNDTIVNCSDRGAGGSGMICVGGQDGLLIYNNYLDQTQREPGHNGNVVFAVEGYNKNFKFYNNVSIKPDTDGTISAVSTGWNMHLETWENEGGNEAYNNTFIGGVALDIGYHAAVKGSSEYSWSFHDNIVRMRELQASGDGTRISAAVDLETAGSDLYIYNNHFIDLAEPVALGGNPEPTFFKNVYIHNNIFENAGFSNTSWSAAISIGVDPDDTINNVHIDNNTFYYSDKDKAGAIVRVFCEAGNSVLKDVTIRNNIFVNANTTWLLFRDSPGIVDSVMVDNNIVYNCGSSNQVIYQGGHPTNLTIDNTTIQAPLINTSGFSLSKGSPGLNAALNLGYGKDIGAVQAIIPEP